MWDPVKGRYIGEGVEDEAVAAPPPVMSMPTLDAAASSAPMPPSMPAGGGLKAARISGGSRYFNPLNAASKTAAAPVHAPVPAMPIPTTFGFMPTQPGEKVNVFKY